MKEKALKIQERLSQAQFCPVPQFIQLSNEQINPKTAQPTLAEKLHTDDETTQISRQTVYYIEPSKSDIVAPCVAMTDSFGRPILKWFERS